jgi:SPP1 family predicted phage head-tail adaptor
MLPAGELSERVTFQRPTTGEDALGQPLTTWVDVETNVHAKVRARPLGLQSAEPSQADAVIVDAPVFVTVRYRTDITAAMRVVWRGVNHAIVGQPVDVGSRREALMMTCSAGGRAGE